MTLLEDNTPEEIQVGFFKCIAVGCPGKGLYVVDGPDDNIRQCEECLHNMYLEEGPFVYRRVEQEPS